MFASLFVIPNDSTKNMSVKRMPQIKKNYRERGRHGVVLSSAMCGCEM